ncbi:MAG: hypothetical protein A3C30_00235 [Candidatus Levybacteria bacterium RIFCSPHIGHO2_02_FULL_40_18]|nr:MAG: hypothetical protein A2869_03930 [Candidatus Levybacteria bacterium RIFCSPHIGHO2_01_FULL_40_58]OGH27131.1 MAG: hypothetical protein A3C30_00235 [Candidatus Levybacteria bacterium RIFCSPHIGHO2_02_FULL_40_18]OGH30990.1 MAG: hypothetical protein A3E43_04650 [Candidatus Levybacteria bacterium RIFCSPHIGHO2_12_FULL_40_31]OGH41001.1 MAG: hypothetical protein A2894_01865 [Candidatus Levybacteria bacterium RIFCSPLOWO2_01_FULL_40_64]OGH48922.1 MAG: hypothetical protein A3I54_02690 [Candidatus Lev
MDYKETLKEVVKVHQQVSHLYPPRQIPSYHLPQGAGTYIDAIAKARENARTQNDINRYLVAELFFKDFIDPTGEYETTKAFNALEKKLKENPLYRGWVKV